MFRRAGLAAVLAMGVLTSCTPLPGSSGEPAAGGATLEFRARLKEGGYATQATVERNTLSSVHHLTVTLQRKQPSVEAAAVLVIPQPNVFDAITFSNLKANSTYWIEAKAYKDADETVPANLISLPASTSVQVSDDDEDVTVAGGFLEIVLTDVVFNGSGEASLKVTEGDYMTPGSATITVGTP